LNRIAIVSAIAIVAALAGIFWAQDRALKGVRADLAAANAALATCQSEKASITASAAACSRSVEEAAAMAAKRASDAQDAVAAAQAREKEASKRVAELLRRRPADPNDLCKSADSMLSEWIKSRAKP
jgi:FtsZ-interacting cell division protein ZipA